MAVAAVLVAVMGMPGGASAQAPPPDPCQAISPQLGVPPVNDVDVMECAVLAIGCPSTQAGDGPALGSRTTTCSLGPASCVVRHVDDPVEFERSYACQLGADPVHVSCGYSTVATGSSHITGTSSRGCVLTAGDAALTAECFEGYAAGGGAVAEREGCGAGPVVLECATGSQPGQAYSDVCNVIVGDPDTVVICTIDRQSLAASKCDTP